MSKGSTSPAQKIASAVLKADENAASPVGASEPASTATATAKPVAATASDMPSTPKYKDKYKASFSERPMQVALEDVLDFVFAKSTQYHPPSTGRLLAFGLYGPLDREKRLRSGHKAEHVVQPWELQAMCEQFEREDIVQTYLPFGYPVSSLTHEEIQSIVNQADRKLKCARGRMLIPQISEAQVLELLVDLPRDEEGKMSFHDMQKATAKWRVDYVAKLKITYPASAKEEMQKQRTRTAAQDRRSLKQGGQQQMSGRNSSRPGSAAPDVPRPRSQSRVAFGADTTQTITT